MSEIESILQEVELLNRQVKPEEAEARLADLIAAMGPSELLVWSTQIERTINTFHRKRQRRLAEALDAARTPSQSSTVSKGPQDTSALDVLMDGFVETLAELSDRHIFQWNTYYRDALREYLDASVPLIMDGLEERWRLRFLEALGMHAYEIFRKGRDFAAQQATPIEARDAKSIGGLNRVVDLVLEWYSANVNPGMPPSLTQAHRFAASSAISALTIGFCDVPMDGKTGGQLLGRSGSWVTWLAFLTGEDLPRVLTAIESERSASLTMSMSAIGHAIDALTAEGTTFSPVPIMAEHKRAAGTLTVSLQVPLSSPDRQRLDLEVWLDSGPVDLRQLQSAANGDRLVVTALTPQARAELARRPELEPWVIALLDGATGQQETQQALVARIRELVYTSLEPSASARPIRYNFAREFPLSNPALIKHYFVVRSSVRDLLSTFERRNGVRLWCSVRRSGKTTAGFDLDDATGDSVYVSQTCDPTGQGPNDAFLYRAVTAALDSRSQLPDAFLRDAVRTVAEQVRSGDQRVVLVLDEYETLFGRLRTAVADSEGLRYTVAQPLLNQFVEFARENLVVFLGQQPNAHAILMDQNQLSPYVEQVAFPLFEHDGSLSSEFAQLVAKVLGPRVAFDSSFATRLHRETSGHPFLTVNLLVEFVDWLIDRRVPLSQLDFTSEEVSAFAQTRFRKDRLALSPEFTFFRDQVIGQALSASSRKNTPWLYAMYQLIRRISIESSTSLGVSHEEFESLVGNLGLEELGFSASYLLTTGTQANFLNHTPSSVGPAIRLLGRLSAVSSPAVVH